MTTTEPISTRPSLRIEELAITNFRTFRERTVIPFRDASGRADAIAVFHGDNGSGKSNALAALDLFFQTAVLALRQTNDEGEILIPWDSEYSVTGQIGDRPIVLAYRDRPYGSEGPMEIEVTFTDDRLGTLRSICTPSGNSVRVRLVRVLVDPEDGQAPVSVRREERDQLVTWLSTPLGPGSHPLTVIDSRRQQWWFDRNTHRSLMHPDLASALFSMRTSRSPEARSMWRGFVGVLERFEPFKGKELSIERVESGGPPELVVEELGRAVLALDELSSGEQHIIVLCAASLLAGTPILAIEEPEISLGYKNQLLFRDVLEDISKAGLVDQIILESHVPTFDGPDVIRFSRDETGATRVRREPSRDEAAREMERRAKAQGATQRWITRDGFTQLPDAMLADLKLRDGGHVWFLKGPQHWEAWPEADVDAFFGSGEDERDG